jgi:peptide/nickel transport system ATP-binding protein/oligopeptide transport system ATP-binding protein
MGEYLVEVRGLRKHFSVNRVGRKSVVRAVDGVDLAIRPGETLGLVGESGCGKSTLGRLMLRLIPPTAGEILLDGEDILKYGKKEMLRARRSVQMIFQNPYAALNPRMRILDAVKAPLDVFHEGGEAEKLRRVHEIFDLVGLDTAFLDRYPHEFSGGQRQRIAIARALVLNPKFIICDEPVSALDVSVRASVLNLMRDIQERLGVAYLFISHDLSVVHHICHSVAVMYLGGIVELAPKSELYSDPLHPYTRALLSAVLQPQAPKRERIILEGEVPSPLAVPRGCRFRTRCPEAQSRCTELEPPLRALGDGRLVACHFAESAKFTRVPPDGDFHI